MWLLKCSLDISFFLKKKYIHWQLHTYLMYFDNIALYYSLPSPSISLHLLPSLFLPEKSFPLLLTSVLYSLSLMRVWAWAWVGGSLLISGYINVLVKDSEWRRVLFGARGGTTDTELWFWLVSARWVHCIYPQCKYLHNCLIVCKLGEIGAFIMLTEVFSAFDTGLSQDEWTHCSVGCVYVWGWCVSLECGIINQPKMLGTV